MQQENEDVIKLRKAGKLATTEGIRTVAEIMKKSEVMKITMSTITTNLLMKLNKMKWGMMRALITALRTWNGGTTPNMYLIPYEMKTSIG